MKKRFKEITLNKNTEKATSTEAYLGIVRQPSETCPMINSCKEDIERKIKEVSKLEEEVSGCNQDTECECSPNYKKIINYLSRDLQDILYDIEEGLENLELIRNDCEDSREKGNLLKELIWEALEGKTIKREQLKDLPQIINLCDDANILNNFEGLEFSRNLDHYFCDKNCKAMRHLMSLYQDCMNLDLGSPGFLDEILENRTKIHTWVKALEEKFREII